MMQIACAEPTPENLKAILGLIEEARGWLTLKDTDQWAKPWPDEKARDARVLRGLQGGKTWLVWDGDTPAATVTLTPRKNDAVWSTPACTCDLADRAVFIHRLITARKYAGLELGADLIDWAGLRGQRLYGAKWIRIDVWSSNKRLHDYYMKRGFEPCGFCADASYPSGALFQKPVSAIAKTSVPQFVESHDGWAGAERLPELAGALNRGRPTLLAHPADRVSLPAESSPRPTDRHN